MVSADFGDLGNALYFLNGLALSTPPLVLVPHTLPLAADVSGITPRHYVCLGDVTGPLEDFAPDRVLLVSGYLLTIGPRLSVVNCWRLLRRLRRKGVPVATTDPFLGLARRPLAIDFAPALPTPEGGIRGVRAHLYPRYLALRLYLFHLMLRGRPHFYPAPLGAEPGRADTPVACYYNPIPPAAPPAEWRSQGSWLFVLAQADYQLQRRRYGERFEELLARRLAEAADAGRAVQVIAPDGLRERLQARLREHRDITVRGRADYAEYISLLMSADCAFFWNWLSFSIIHRVIQGLPVLFFDRGHMMRILPREGATALETFYLGWRPPLLDMGHPLSTDRISELCEETVARFRRITRHMERCRKPRQLLEGLTPPSP